VAIAWLLKHPARVVPVVGTVKEERLKAQVGDCLIFWGKKHNRIKKTTSQS